MKERGWHLLPTQCWKFLVLRFIKYMIMKHYNLRLRKGYLDWTKGRQLEVCKSHSKSPLPERMYSLSLIFPDPFCAHLCHFFVLTSFWVVCRFLPFLLVFVIKYLGIFMLKQQDIPENNCGSIFSIELIINRCLITMKSLMPYKKCGGGWIFSVENHRNRRDLSLL